MVIDAVANLRDKGELYNLVFVGDGKEGAILKLKSMILVWRLKYGSMVLVMTR